MVKNPNTVEGNIEICCSEMAQNSQMNFLQLFMAGKRKRNLFSQMHKNKHKMPIFLLFHDLGKIVMSFPEQYSKIPMFNLFVNCQ